MTARLTAKEAKRLGLDLSSGGEIHHTKKDRQPTVPYHTRCRKCGVEFTTMASETRHMNDEGHRAFELIITQERNTDDRTQGEAPARDAEQDEGVEA